MWHPLLNPLTKITFQSGMATPPKSDTGALIRWTGYFSERNGDPKKGDTHALIRWKTSLFRVECRPPIFNAGGFAHAFSSKVKRNSNPTFLKNTPSRALISRKWNSWLLFSHTLPHLSKMCHRLLNPLTQITFQSGMATPTFGRKPRKWRYFGPYFPEKSARILLNPRRNHVLR